jgi:hypothetical protein
MMILIYTRGARLWDAGCVYLQQRCARRAPVFKGTAGFGILHAHGDEYADVRRRVQRQDADVAGAGRRRGARGLGRLRGPWGLLWGPCCLAGARRGEGGHLRRGRGRLRRGRGRGRAPGARARRAARGIIIERIVVVRGGAERGPGPVRGVPGVHAAGAGGARGAAPGDAAESDVARGQRLHPGAGAAADRLLPGVCGGAGAPVRAEPVRADGAAGERALQARPLGALLRGRGAGAAARAVERRDRARGARLERRIIIYSGRGAGAAGRARARWCACARARTCWRRTSSWGAPTRTSTTRSCTARRRCCWCSTRWCTWGRGGARERRDAGARRRKDSKRRIVKRRIVKRRIIRAQRRNEASSRVRPGAAAARSS